MFHFLQRFTVCIFAFLAIAFLAGCTKGGDTVEGADNKKQVIETYDAEKTKELVKIIAEIDRLKGHPDDNEEKLKEIAKRIIELNQRVVKKKTPAQIKLSKEKQAKMVANQYFDDPDIIALCFAILTNNLKEVNRLLEKGVDVNTKGKVNITPLLFAMHKGGKKIFLVMLQKGANPNIPILDIDVPKELKFHYVFGLGTCATSNAATCENDTDWLEIVLKHGGDPNVKAPISRFGMNTPLYEAICARNLKSVKLLIKAGADINHLDDYGGTPVMAAASSRCYQIAFTLLQAGANWKIKEENGHNLATICYMFSQDLKKEFPKEYEYNQKVLKFLEEKGVNLKAAKKRADEW